MRSHVDFHRPHFLEVGIAGLSTIDLSGRECDFDVGFVTGRCVGALFCSDLVAALASALDYSGVDMYVCAIRELGQ